MLRLFGVPGLVEPFTSVRATGMLTAGAGAMTAIFAIPGENGKALPIPMGFAGVHLTDLGVLIGVTPKPPSVQAGVLGRFTIGPGAGQSTGAPVQVRALNGLPPTDEFVMVVG